MGEPYQLRKFCMRFVHVSEMKAIPQDTSDHHMMRLMAQYHHEHIWLPRIDDQPGDPSTPTRALMPDWALDAMDGESAQASWFSAVRKHLVASLAYAEHSTVDHPVACLHVAASSQQSFAAGTRRGKASSRAAWQQRRPVCIPSPVFRLYLQGSRKRVQYALRLRVAPRVAP